MVEKNSVRKAGETAQKTDDDVVLSKEGELAEEGANTGESVIPGEILKDFALDMPSLSLLSSMQAQFVLNDIRKTGRTAAFSDNESELKRTKFNWLKAWRTTVKENFENMFTEPRPALWDETSKEYSEQISLLKKSPDRIAAGLVLVELVSWDAYWPLHASDKQCKNVSIAKNARAEFLADASKSLGFEDSLAKDIHSQLNASHKALSGYWWKVGTGVLGGIGLGAVSAGLAMPIIAGAVGTALGCSGAAATSAGLAALGGGSIAAGGMGMAGGMGVVVGGGALLGLGSGSVTGTVLAKVSARSVLESSAKLEVVLKEFILQGQRDIAQIQKILFAQRQSIQKLEVEIDSLRLAGSESDARIKELEKAIELMRKALERNTELAR